MSKPKVVTSSKLPVKTTSSKVGKPQPPSKSLLKSPPKKGDKTPPPADKTPPPPLYPKRKLPKPKPKYEAPRPTFLKKWIPPDERPKPPRPPVYEAPKPVITHHWIPPDRRKKSPPPKKYEPPPLPPATKHWIPPDQRKKKPKEPPKFVPPKGGITVHIKDSAIPRGWGHFVFFNGLKRPGYLVGDISQENRMFKGLAGLQGIANCVVACAFTQISKEIRKWDKALLDQIINYGHHYYSESLRYRACKFEDMDLSKLLSYFFADKVKVLVEIETHLQKVVDLLDCGKVEALKDIIFGYLSGDRFSAVFEIADKAFAIFRGQTTKEEKFFFYFDPEDHTSVGEPMNVRPRGSGFAIVTLSHSRSFLVEDLVRNLPGFIKTQVRITPVKVAKWADITASPPVTLEDVTAIEKPEHNECRGVEEEEDEEEKRLAAERAKLADEEAAKKATAVLEINPQALEVQERPSFLKDLDLEKSFKEQEVQKQALADKMALAYIKPKPISRYVDIVPNRVMILRGLTHQADQKFSKYEGKQTFGNMISCFTMLRFYKAKRWIPRMIQDIMDYGEEYYQKARASKPVGFQFRLSHFPKIHEMNNVNFYLEAEESVAFGQLNSNEYEILDLPSCLQNFFINNTCGVLHGPLLVAVWLEDGFFYMFDPNERDEKGRRIQDPETHGLACVTVFKDLQDLCDLYTNNLKREDRRDYFSISSIKILNDPNIPLKWHNFEGFKKNRWILRADFCQDDPRFEIPGRNVQCTAMAAMALMYSKILDNFTKWSRETLNEILMEGDKYYRECLEDIKKSKPNFPHEMLCADELMKRREFKAFNKDVRLNVTCPILGLLKMREKVEGLYDFKSGLVKFLEDYTHGVCTSGSISVGFWRISPKEFYYFDSHSRNNQGLMAPGGRACLIRTTNPEELSLIMLSNLPPSRDGEYNLYELGIKVYEIEKDVARPNRNYYRPISDEDGDFVVIVRGQFSNASEKFVINMMKQGIPMNLIALAYNILKPGANWNSTDIDLILDRGDAFYVDCYAHREVPEVEVIDLTNVKKEFPLGYNNFVVEYETIYQGNLDNTLIEFLADFYKDLPGEDNPRMEVIFETQYASVAIFRDPTGFYVFDSFPRDKYGGYFRAYLDHEDSDVRPRSLPNSGAGDDQETVEKVVDMSPEAAGDMANVEQPDEEAWTMENFFASKSDRNWDFGDNGPRKAHKNEVVLEFARINGRACCLRFLMVQDLILHLYKFYTPWKRAILECKLHKINITPEVALVDKLRPKMGQKYTSIYDGDWFNFKEIRRGFWVLNSTLRLDEDIYPKNNRGRQEIPVIITLLQYCYLYPRLAGWTSDTLDKIISYGDRIYTRIKRDMFKNLKLTTCLKEEDIETIVVDTPVTIDNIYKKMRLATHFLECNISLYISGHIRSKDEEEPTDEINFKQALNNFFDLHKFGLINCNGLLVGIYKGTTVYYMFDPHERGPDGRKDYTGTPCLTRFMDLNKLRELYITNIDPFGNNFFDIYKVELSEFSIHDKDVLEDRNPKYPEKPGESVIPGKELLGGWKKISGGKSILRGPLDNDLYSQVKAPAFIMVAIAMSIIHKSPTWTYPLLIEIAQLADLIFKLSRKEDEEDFDLETHPLKLCDVKNTMEIGSTKCHVVLRYPSIEGEFSPKNMRIWNLRRCLDELFKTNTHGVIEASGAFFAVWEEIEPLSGKKAIYFYDPVSRSPIGMPISFGGKPCTIHFVHDTFMVAEHVKNVLLGEGKSLGKFTVTAAEPVVGSMKKKKKKLSSIQEQLEQCQLIRNKNDISKIMKMNEEELRQKEERQIYQLGRSEYHCVEPGEILRSYLSLDNPKYAENARGNQDMVCSIVACVLFRLEYIDFWAASTLDLIMDTATQIYIDSYICFEPDDKKLGLKNIIRRFFIKEEQIKLTVYQPFPAAPLSNQAICLNLQQYFIDEKFGTEEQKFVLLKSNDYWFAVFFANMFYYLYEPHSTNHKAELDPCGTSVIFRFKTVEDLATRFLTNYGDLTTTFRLCHIKIEITKKEETKNICDRNQYR